jgi:hypothetical protein
LGRFLKVQILEVPDFQNPRAPVENEVDVVEAVEEVVEDAIFLEPVELQLTAAGVGKDVRRHIHGSHGALARSITRWPLNVQFCSRKNILAHFCALLAELLQNSIQE